MLKGKEGIWETRFRWSRLCHNNKIKRSLIIIILLIKYKFLLDKHRNVYLEMYISPKEHLSTLKPDVKKSVILQVSQNWP